MGFYIEQAEHIVSASEQHILNLIIEPSFREPALCFQIHRMRDGSMTVFWNFSPDAQAVVSLARQFVLAHGLPLDAPFPALFDDPSFREELRGACPAENRGLTRDEIAIVTRVTNARLPQNVDKPHGLDGHDYTLILSPGKNSRRYACWCVLPREWEVLKPLISLLTGIAGLDQGRYGC